MTTPSATAEQRAADRIPVRIWSINGPRDEVGVHFRDQDLQACGIHDGDRLVLDINGAVVLGDVSIDLKGPWLGTQKVKGWSHRRITDALRAVGVSNPSEHVALIVERNGVAPLSTDPLELQKRATALAMSGFLSAAVGNPTPTKSDRVIQEFARSPAVVAEVLRIAAWPMRTLRVRGTFPPSRWLALPRSASRPDPGRRRRGHDRQRGRVVPDVPSAPALRWRAGSRSRADEAAFARDPLGDCVLAANQLTEARPCSRLLPARRRAESGTSEPL